MVFKYLQIVMHEISPKVWDEEFILLICMRPTWNVQLGLRQKMWGVLVAVCPYNCAVVKQRFGRRSKGGSLQSPWSGAGSSHGSRMPLHAQLMVSQLSLVSFSQLGVGFTPKKNFAVISSAFFHILLCVAVSSIFASPHQKPQEPSPPLPARWSRMLQGWSRC